MALFEGISSILHYFLGTLTEMGSIRMGWVGVQNSIYNLYIIDGEFVVLSQNYQDRPKGPL